MILRFIKVNNPFIFILFPVFAGLLWFKKLINSETFPFFPGESQNLLYAPIDNLLTNQPFIEVVISMVLAIFLAVMVQSIHKKYSFIRARTMLPALLYIIMLGGFVSLHTLHPVYIGAGFLMLAINRLFSVFDQAKPYSAVFDSGFLVALGSLFYINLALFFPLLLVGITNLSRDHRWREYAICLLGFLLPILFGSGFIVATGQSGEMIKMIQNVIFNSNEFFNPGKVMLIYLGFVSFIVLLASIAMIRKYDSLKVSSRKYFIFFFQLFLFSLIIFFAVPGTSQEIFIIALIPFTYLISDFFVFMKSSIWDELLFTGIIALVITLQIAPPL